MNRFLSFIGEGIGYIFVAVAIVILFKGCELTDAYVDRVKAETKLIQKQ